MICCTKSLQIRSCYHYKSFKYLWKFMPDWCLWLKICPSVWHVLVSDIDIWLHPISGVFVSAYFSIIFLFCWFINDDSWQVVLDTLESPTQHMPTFAIIPAHLCNNTSIQNHNHCIALPFTPLPLIMT